MKKHLLAKAALVTLAITTVVGTGGVADAGYKAPTKKPATTTTCDIDPAACTATFAAAGIRW